jgi:hypothetical protein
VRQDTLRQSSFFRHQYRTTTSPQHPRCRRCQTFMRQVWCPSRYGFLPPSQTLPGFLMLTDSLRSLPVCHPSIISPTSRSSSLPLPEEGSQTRTSTNYRLSWTSFGLFWRHVGMQVHRRDRQSISLYTKSRLQGHSMRDCYY